jgi:hypothetical protein
MTTFAGEKSKKQLEAQRLFQYCHTLQTDSNNILRNI